MIAKYIRTAICFSMLFSATTNTIHKNTFLGIGMFAVVGAISYLFYKDIKKNEFATIDITDSPINLYINSKTPNMPTESKISCDLNIKIDDIIDFIREETCER